jgi:hypothetical protein
VLCAVNIDARITIAEFYQFVEVRRRPPPSVVPTAVTPLQGMVSAMTHVQIVRNARHPQTYSALMSFKSKVQRARPPPSPPPPPLPRHPTPPTSRLLRSA